MPINRQTFHPIIRYDIITMVDTNRSLSTMELQQLNVEKSQITLELQLK